MKASLVWFPALVAAALALAVYVRTLAPGLIAIIDTPEFQFVGRILGTAHTPGYPLYVVISHFFGYLPFGSLAWRINLMSAVFGAGTVGLMVLAAAASGCSAIVAAAAALGFGFAWSFWFTATTAEVYTLHTFLVAAMTYSLVRWRNSRRTPWFFTAIGFFALGLGHHTTIVLLAPAVAIFGILVAPKFALHPRTIAGILLLLAAGFAQYLFVLVRTLQGAYLGSEAHNLKEMWDVMRGYQFTRFVEPLALEPIGRRGPLIASTILQEVSPVACVLALVGFVVLLVRDRTLLALCGLSIIAVAAFGTFYRVQDVSFFLLPAFFFLWLMAAHGVEGVVRLLAPHRRWASLVAAIPLVALAAWQFSRNVESRDLSHDRLVMRYFEALFRQVPERSAVLKEDFIVDRMIAYKVFGEDVTHGRDVLTLVVGSDDQVTSLAGSGYQVFAFEKTANILRKTGAEFDYSAWPMQYGPLRQFLTDQPAGTVVAIAVPAAQLGPALAQDALPLEVIGGRRPPAVWSNVVAIGAVGRSGGVQDQATDHRATVFVGQNSQIGTAGVKPPADILAEATYDGAAIRIGARELIRSAIAPVVAVWSSGGTLVHAFALTPDFQVPMAAGPLSVRRLRGIRGWTVIGPSTIDITAAAASGHMMVTSLTAPLIMYAGRQRPLAPILHETPPGDPPIQVKEFVGGGAPLQESLRQDGWPPDPRLDSLAHVYRIFVGNSNDTTHLGFGGLPDVVLAASPPPVGPVRVYGLDLTGQLEPIDARTLRLHAARDHHSYFFGAGWSAVDADRAGPFRATVDPEAELTIPCGAGGCSKAAFQLRPFGEAGSIELVVNGVALGSQMVHQDWNRYSWNIPASALKAGMNSFVLKPSQPVLLGDALFDQVVR